MSSLNDRGWCVPQNHANHASTVIALYRLIEDKPLMVGGDGTLFTGPLRSPPRHGCDLTSWQPAPAAPCMPFHEYRSFG